MQEFIEIFKAYKEFDKNSKLFIAKMYQEEIKKKENENGKLLQNTKWN